MKVTSIVGTRPNNIKCAALYPVLYAASIQQKILSTGQHFDEEMKAIDLKIDEKTECGNDPQRMYTWLLQPGRLEGLVMVYGDTNTSYVGAVAAKKLGLTLLHVEAGMRCGDLMMQEEINRTIIDRISDINYCVTEEHTKNVPEDSAVVVGDVMYDLWLKSKQEHIKEEGFPLITLHRAEHTLEPEPFRELLRKIRATFEQTPVFMIHPRTLKFCLKHSISLEGFEIHESQPYHHFQRYLARCGAVITDSGGVSKEAVWANKRVYVLRDVSEWGIPTVGHWGENWKIVLSRHTLDSGDGKACEKIAEHIKTWL